MTENGLKNAVHDLLLRHSEFKTDQLGLLEIEKMDFLGMNKRLSENSTPFVLAEEEKQLAKYFGSKMNT